LIHHFTSIKTLGLILKYGKIKFTRLDLVNDPLDGFSSSFQNSRRLSFVSCFTRRTDDSLPMWAMYTEQFSGVRISFPENLFGSVEQNRFDLHIRKISENPLNQKAPFLAGPEDIDYRDSINEIDHEIITDVENKHVQPIAHGKRFNPWKVGKYKLKDWAFEQECRFIIPAIDHSFVAGDAKFETKIEEINNELNNLPKAVYISFDRKVIPEMDILLGPKTDEADFLIVEALVNTLTSGVNSIKRSSKKIN
jgi:hypothetical protein